MPDPCEPHDAPRESAEQQPLDAPVVHGSRCGSQRAQGGHEDGRLKLEELAESAEAVDACDAVVSDGDRAVLAAPAVRYKGSCCEVVPENRCGLARDHGRLDLEPPSSAWN